jgi:hypothetical protein
MRNRLGLHRGIDNHPLQVLGADGASLVCHRQTFLDQRDERMTIASVGALCGSCPNQAVPYEAIGGVLGAGGPDGSLSGGRA